MIRLNGSIWVDDTEYFFEDFEVEIDEDLELPFDELIEDDFEEFDFDEEDYCDGNREDCEFDEYEKQEDFNAEFEFLLNLYTEILSEGCVCKDCIREILLEFLDDFWDILGE